MLALAVAAWLGRWVLTRGAKFDAALSIVVLIYSIDVALVASKPMQDAMWMELPNQLKRRQVFSSSLDPPYAYKKPDWAGPLYLAMLANTGVIRCYGTPPFDQLGALARSDEKYRGEVFVTPRGAASIARWSPNAVTVTLSGIEQPSQLIYNQNFDEGFQAQVLVGNESQPAIVGSAEHRVAIDIPAFATQVRIAYQPPGLRYGLFGVVLYGGVMWLRRHLDKRWGRK